MKNFNVKRSAFSANEDGTSETRVIPILFDAERLVFSTPLPKFVYAHLDNFVTVAIDANSIIGGVIESEQCRTVFEIYERACEAYCNWRLTLSGPTKLWVGGIGEPSEFTTKAFGVKSMAALGYTPVKVGKKDDRITMVEVTADGNFGRLVGVAGAYCNPALVDDTPEMRAKLDRLIKSVNLAGILIQGIGLAADPAKYIMEIEELELQRTTAQMIATATDQPAVGDPKPPVIDDPEDF